MKNNITIKKMGARVLSTAEIKLTLSTYEKLKEQIEDVRKQKWDSGEPSALQNQKTNNISVLGARGTGKTSVMKTLIRDLEQQNKEIKKQKNIPDDVNILLPMIIPEAMSDSSNLMSMILGLFKNEMDKIEEKDKNQKRNCWEVQESDITRQYNELMKKFCFIQPDFKTVPIRQYTTENDYVKKSSEIYNAEIEFLSSLNGFIKLLLEKNSKIREERLIFVFIDDIDLSTHRCVDVVKTLLAYLSHPRVVTILSGDLDTFEEALTVDFMRKENALQADVADTSFLLSEKDTLLDGKKRLTYEYLKKILPSQYRHNVKYWDLASRGDYRVDIEANWHKDGDVQENTRAFSLAELLTKCFSDLEQPPIFQYRDHVSGTLKNLPQLFHIFDSTARGLNNVYNVLLETYDIIKEKDSLSNYEDILFQQLKSLLETIVASNMTLNTKRNILFNDIIQFGTDFESTNINLQNMNAFIANDKEEVEDSETNGFKLQELILENFILFSFIEFAIRILKQTKLLNEDLYLEIRFYMIRDMVNNPYFSGSKIELEDQIASKKQYRAKKGDDRPCVDLTEIMIFDLDFYIAIILYNYLIEKGFDFWINNANKNNANRKEMALYYLILSLSEVTRISKQEVSCQLVSQFPEMFRIILRILSGDKNSIFIRNIFSDYLEKIFLELSKEGLIDILLLKVPETFKLLINAISKEIVNRFFVEELLMPLGLKKKEYLLVGEQYKEQLKIIFSIEKHNLWTDSFSDIVLLFIENRVKEVFSRILLKEKNLLVDISGLLSAYTIFLKAYKGESNTIAKKLQSSLRTKIKPPYQVEIGLYENIKLEIERLAYSKAWYGRNEAFQMLAALDKAKLILTFKGDMAGESANNQKIFYMWLHIVAYILKGKGDVNFEKIYTISLEMAKFLALIYEGFELSVQKSIESYKDILKQDVEDEILSRFEDLFSEKLK